jgi:hypothetical protein
MFSPHIIMLIHRFMMFGNFMDDVRRVYNVSMVEVKGDQVEHQTSDEGNQ